jgi:hypothetical protein
MPKTTGRDAARIEEWIVYALMIGIGSIPVWIAMGPARTFGVEATIGLVMIGLGLAGLLASAWRAFRPRN